MNIWAHRGCSQMYPENTLLAFDKAMQIKGLTGIELDIQLTKDGYMVVIHDEAVDRTTNGHGYVKDMTLKEIKNLECGMDEKIPLIEEVLDVLGHRMKDGLLLNIELKNSIFSYEGMEEKITQLIYERGLDKSVIYSTFYAKSIEKLRRLVPDAEIGILDRKVSDCIFKVQGGCGADAIHPFWREIDLQPDELERTILKATNGKKIPVRAWFTGHLYPEKPTGTKLDLLILEKQGITDVFLNEPERYL